MKVIEKIQESLVDEKNVVFSFEFFQPKTEDDVENLLEMMDRMVAHGPAFCDITWGAGGSTTDLTLDIANKMQNLICVESMMHLTCTNMPVDKIDHTLQTIKSNGLQNILDLCGDPSHGQDKFVQIQGGFACALDLVTHIRAKYGDYFGITVAGYPEAHPEAIAADGLASPEAYQSDLAYLKRKVDAGADFIVTQLFHDTDIFLKFFEFEENGLVGSWIVGKVRVDPLTVATSVATAEKPSTVLEIVLATYQKKICEN